VPALLIGFFTVKLGGTTNTLPQGAEKRSAAMWRQFGAAAAGFAAALLPVIPGLFYMFRSRGDHPFDMAPRFIDLAWTLGPGWFLPVLAATAFMSLMIAAWTTLAPADRSYFQGWRILLCASLALVPILILFGVSRGTPLHIFVQRYRLVALPGIALAWALVISGLRPRVLRLLLCVVLVAATAYGYLTSPIARQHAYTWKYALDVAQKNAFADNATVLICSDLPESDYMSLPIGDEAKDSNLFAQLSYYKLTVPVIGLPRSLNEDAIRIGSAFLRHAAERHARFLAMGYSPSARTLEWLKGNAVTNYNVRELGSYDDIQVLEFEPKK